MGDGEQIIYKSLAVNNSYVDVCVLLSPPTCIAWDYQISLILRSIFSTFLKIEITLIIAHKRVVHYAINKS